MIIRRAKIDDIEGIEKLLYQVHDVHVQIRPDLFKKGYKKYNTLELISIINNDETPIYVAVEDEILGYIFCVYKQTKGESLQPIKSLYIDDFCVLDTVRNKHIGTKLYEYVVDIAKNNDCYNITLNVWEGNDSALNFYHKLGLKTQRTFLEQKLK